MHTTAESPQQEIPQITNCGLKASEITGTRSDLARTATARGASRACSASASPPSGSPARRTRKNRNSDQISTRRNQIHPNPEPAGPESNRRDHSTPTPTGKRIQPRPYPLLLRVARGGRRCGRCGVAVSHLAGAVRGLGAERTCRPRRRARVGSERCGGENPKKRCGGRAARGKARTDSGGGWMDR